jgi:hypothetical protein
MYYSKYTTDMIKSRRLQCEGYVGHMTDVVNDTPERKTQIDEPYNKIERLELKLCTE